MGRGARREAEGRGAQRRERHARGRPDSRRGDQEHTLNMDCNIVTLEVSKLSGWLKAVAHCRVEGRACDAGRGVHRPGGGRAWSGGIASGVHGQGPTQGVGTRACAERT